MQHCSVIIGGVVVSGDVVVVEVLVDVDVDDVVFGVVQQIILFPVPETSHPVGQITAGWEWQLDGNWLSGTLWYVDVISEPVEQFCGIGTQGVEEVVDVEVLVDVDVVDTTRQHTWPVTGQLVNEIHS